MPTINIEKLIYQNDYLSCALPVYPCLTLLAEKPFITVSYLAEACYIHFLCTQNHEVTKARKDEEMCALQQKKASLSGDSPSIKNFVTSAYSTWTRKSGKDRLFRSDASKIKTKENSYS